MTKTGKLQARIEEQDAQLLELQYKRLQSKQQIDALEAERRGYVIAARVQKSPDAQKAIERLVPKITKAQDEDTLNGEALLQISRELEATKAELQRELWRERCDPLRRLLKSRATGEMEQQVLRLALDLRAKLKEIHDSDAGIISEFLKLHPLLARHVGILRAVGERRSSIISSNLEPFLENPFTQSWKDSLGKDPARDVATVFGDALQTLDSVAEVEPAAEPARA